VDAKEGWMLVVAALLLVVLGAAFRGLRTTAGEPRWPFRAAAAISGGAVLALLVATAVALTAGRETWNDWVRGSQSSESLTLWLVLVVGPVLLGTCVVLIVTGMVLRGRHQRHSGHGTSL